MLSSTRKRAPRKAEWSRRRLSNIYLREVLDQWFERDVRPRMRGRAFAIRFAADFVMGFEFEDDARRVMEVLPKRFARFGLGIHPGKTRLVDFRPPARTGADSASFNFLGFTHHWDISRKGNPYVRKQTRKERFARALRSINQWCRINRHQSLPEQCRALARKLRGHYNYYGVTGNGRRIGEFRFRMTRIWRKWLARRSRENKLDWDKFNHILDRFPLPSANIVHSAYA